MARNTSWASLSIPTAVLWKLKSFLKSWFGCYQSLERQFLAMKSYHSQAKGKKMLFQPASNQAVLYSNPHYTLVFLWPSFLFKGDHLMTNIPSLNHNLLPTVILTTGTYSHLKMLQNPLTVTCGFWEMKQTQKRVRCINSQSVFSKIKVLFCPGIGDIILEFNRIVF